MAQTGEYRIQPELHLRDGRILRSLGDAMALLREHDPASTIATRFFTGWSARRPTSNARRRPQISLPGRWNSTSFVVRRSRRGARSAGGARTPSGVDGDLGDDAFLAPFEFQLAVELALNDPLHDAHAELGRKPPLGCRCTNLRRHRNPQQGTTS